MNIKNYKESFGNGNGLSDDVVHGIYEDEDGNLWISTNTGISKLDKRQKIFINLDSEDGLQSNEFNSGAYYKLRNNELAFGGINGLNIFNPKQLKFTEVIPGVTVNSVEIKGEKKEVKSKYRLKYNENTINMELFVADYSNKNKKYY
ncbi:MAG: hypothetical protein E7214_09840 [Clostridium sp.]|nr:hypothetical protein [Clostridium sp.]